MTNELTADARLAIRAKANALVDEYKAGRLSYDELNEMGDCSDGWDEDERNAYLVAMEDVDAIRQIDRIGVEEGCPLCSAPQSGTPHCPRHS